MSLLISYLYIKCFILADSFDKNCTEIQTLIESPKTEEVNNLNSLNSSIRFPTFGLKKSYLLVQNVIIHLI